MKITFDAATEVVNVIPPLAFKAPEEILIVAVRVLSVEVPGNEISPETVAVPPSILQAFATFVSDD